MSKGWKLGTSSTGLPEQLLTPPVAPDGQQLCVQGAQWGLAPYVSCPPVTRGDPHAQCGLVVTNCSVPGGKKPKAAAAAWVHNSSGLICTSAVHGNPGRWQC